MMARGFWSRADCCRDEHSYPARQASRPVAAGMIVMPKRLIAAAAIVALASMAHAGDQGDPEKSCDGNTYEMVECLKARTAQWDKRMTIAYQQAIKDADPKQRDQLGIGDSPHAVLYFVFILHLGVGRTGRGEQVVDLAAVVVLAAVQHEDLAEMGPGGA